MAFTMFSLDTKLDLPHISTSLALVSASLRGGGGSHGGFAFVTARQ